jgi:hypothetical protein
MKSFLTCVKDFSSSWTSLPSHPERTFSPSEYLHLISLLAAVWPSVSGSANTIGLGSNTGSGFKTLLLELLAVLRIRIHRIHMFLGHPDPDFSIISSCKNSKENLGSYCFVTLFDFLSLKNDVNVPSKSNRLKKFKQKISVLLAS